MIFFDDNVEKQIISVQPISGEDVDQEMLQKDLISKGRIVSVDSFKICMENDYFIQAFELACSSPLKPQAAVFERQASQEEHETVLRLG